MMTTLRIATRGSKLALWQAEYVRSCLTRNDPALRVELLVIKTEGDRILSMPLSEIGGKGLFTKEIEEALLDGRADLAVHSMKDMPAHIPEGLMLCAVPERADPADALVLPAVEHPAAESAAALLHTLPPGARVGTSSLRRVCQLRRLRKDLEIVPLRGNVDTRLRKLDAGEFDAAVLAAAGLVRLGFAQRIAARFSFVDMLPACGQGALGLECRANDEAVKSRLWALGDPAATVCVLAERAFALRLGGNCQTPLGAHARLCEREDGQPELAIDGMVGSADGQTVLRAALVGPVESGESLGSLLAEKLLGAGAFALIREALG